MSVLGAPATPKSPRPLPATMPTLAAEALRLLDRHLAALGADVERDERAGRVEYCRGGVLFAALRGNTRRVHVGFSRLGRARSTRILHGATGRLPGLRHRVVVEAPGDVDSELLAWLGESYEVAADPPWR